jgi:hypothetical protein
MFGLTTGKINSVVQVRICRSDTVTFREVTCKEELYSCTVAQLCDYSSALYKSKKLYGGKTTTISSNLEGTGQRHASVRR